jgi:hypothetical protein
MSPAASNFRKDLDPSALPDRPSGWVIGVAMRAAFVVSAGQ